MGTEHLEWGVEGVKTQKTGILHAFNAGTKEWCILVDGGERLIFTADVCQSINGDNGETVFNSLLKGDEISYVLEYGEIKDVALVSHMDTEVLAAQVRNTFDAAMEPIEAMGSQISGTIKVMKMTGDRGFGFITPIEKGYKDVFFHSDTCMGGFAEFQAIYKREQNGEEIKVTFNVQDSPKGPMALNVAIDTSKAIA